MRIIIGILIAIAVLAVMPADVQAQSDDGLVAEWHFDEGSGNVLVDSSGNGNDGTIYGATWTTGISGKALRFDGVDDYINIDPNPFASGSDAGTIDAWIYPQSYGNGKSNPPSDIRGFVGEYYDYYGVGIDDMGITGYVYHTGSNRITTSSDINIDLNKWYHVVYQWNKNGKNQLYVNGDLVGTSTGCFLTAYTPSPAMLIGCTRSQNYYPTLYFNGKIDEVAIYSKTLTAEEIKQQYEGKQTALSLTKLASPHSIKQGQTTTITLTVENTGITEIKDIEVSDTISSDLVLVKGETSKASYTSLKPHDSRELQYTIQLNEAGTFNLDPATAMYADENGNYHTVKSKTVAIEVKPSLITTPVQTQTTTGNNVQTASVHLHGEKTDVVMGEDILLKLAAVNLITKPTMHVQVIITPPSGMSVTSSEFVQSGAGLFTASYEIEPGVGRDIEVRMRSNQVGDFVVNGRIVYYFGDDIEHAEDHTLTLPITVRAEAGAERTVDISGSKGSSAPGFGSAFAAAGVFLVALLIKRRRLR